MTELTMTSTEPSGVGRFARRAGPRHRVGQVNIQMEPELVTAIDAAATAAGSTSRSMWVREACLEKLRRSEKRQAREKAA